MQSARSIARHASLLVATVLSMLGLAVPAQAGPDTTLCRSSTTRATIPDTFPLQACFDGNKLVVVNPLGFPVIVSVTGNGVGQAVRVPKLGGTIPSAVLSILGPHTPNLVPPGYQIAVPVGAGEAKVSLSTTPDLTRGYAVIKIIWNYLPVGESAKAIADLVSELTDVSEQHTNCRNTNNNWGDIGCDALLYRNITFAVARAGIQGGVAGSLKTLIDSAAWSNAATQDALKARNGVSAFTIKAAPAPQAPKLPPAQSNQPPPSNLPVVTNNPPSPAPNHTQPLPPPPVTAPAPTPPSRTITVQNKYLVGASGMAEDSIPAYLSSRMEPRCRVNGCMLDGTEMASGDTITVTCYAHGAAMTNQNQSISDDDNNPNRADSSLWYYGTRSGQRGFISEVYITSQHRGGLGLPVC